MQTNFSALTLNPRSTVRTAGGSLVTTRTDNLRLEATVQWLGPSQAASLIVYNGHEAVTGWGICVLAGNDSPPNRIAVLAGGVVLGVSPLTLTTGKWQRIRMDRVGQLITLTVSDLDGQDAEQRFVLGLIRVNPVGGALYHSIEQTSVGDGFNGFIADARVERLDGGTVLESWDFSAPAGRFARFADTAVGMNGNVLYLSNTLRASA